MAILTRCWSCSRIIPSGTGDHSTWETVVPRTWEPGDGSAMHGPMEGSRERDIRVFMKGASQGCRCQDPSEQDKGQFLAPARQGQVAVSFPWEGMAGGS